VEVRLQEPDNKRKAKEKMLAVDKGKEDNPKQKK
jgi:hypothetical protein